MSTWIDPETRAIVLAELERRIAEDPDAIPARFDRACLLTGAGRLEDAKQAYLALLSRVPGHAGALNNLGALFLAEGHRPRGARRLCRGGEAQSGRSDGPGQSGQYPAGAGRDDGGTCGVRRGAGTRSGPARGASRAGAAIFGHRRRASGRAASRARLSRSAGDRAAVSRCGRAGALAGAGFGARRQSRL